MSNATKAADKNAKAQLNTIARQRDMANNTFAEQEDFNKKLLATEQQQASRATEDDRFLAQRSLQNAAQGVMGAMGNALSGSGTNVMGNMLRNRQDTENVTYWNQLQKNWDDAQNSYDTAQQSLTAARNDAEADIFGKTMDVLGNWANTYRNDGNFNWDEAALYKYAGEQSWGQPLGNYDAFVAARKNSTKLGSNDYNPTTPAQSKLGGKRVTANYGNSSSSYFDNVSKAGV